MLLCVLRKDPVGAQALLLHDAMGCDRQRGSWYRQHRCCENNCLIDSLRQCLGIVADCRQVRRDLINEFAGAPGRGHVAVASYLDVEARWRSIIRSLFLHNVSGLPVTCNLEDVCVNALSANNAGHGSVEGNMGAPRTLVVLNYNDQHFDPCLPLRG